MTQAYLSALQKTSNFTLTENDGGARETTNSAMLDFFAQGGAIRTLSEDAQISIFARAYSENPLLALKAMFYFRDPRGGQGQRQSFRNQLNWLAQMKPELVGRNIGNIPHLGRWDDLYSLIGTPCEAEMWTIFDAQLHMDMESLLPSKGMTTSLLAKWLKSENASSNETKRLGRLTRKALGFKPKFYRQVLSQLRAKLNVVERHVSAGEWDEIEYSHVPSNAMMKYKKAFSRHDTDRFGGFIKKVNAGEEKLNASVLFPHEIVGKLMDQEIEPPVAQAMWSSLPDYIGKEENSIAVVDTSGSMAGTPMNVAIALGLYLSERATGPYKDHFITFSERPTLQRVVGRDIAVKVAGMRFAQWGMNTDIVKTFRLLLNAAINGGVSQDDMVDKVYIISDMEFDKATGNGWSKTATTPDKTVFDTIRGSYRREGYVMPNLVFWNVNARNVQFPMSMDDRGFQMVSGWSPSIFKSLMSGEFVSAYDLMVKVLMDDRYKDVTL